MAADQGAAHSFALVDRRTNNILGEFTTRASDQTSGERRLVKSMNDGLVEILADRMVELDIEAGIFHWPTEQDYPNIRWPKDSARWPTKATRQIRFLGMVIKW